MRNVLVITYYWPPSGGPGVQRVLKFCKYLPEFGWNPIVLTVEKGQYPAIDESLGKEVNPKWIVEKTKTNELFGLYKQITQEKSIPTFQLSKSENEGYISRISRWIRYNLIIPDARAGWYWYAVRKGAEIIARYNIDLIFSSGPPHSLHFIAKRLAMGRIPWVADFRDPWVERFYYQENHRWLIIGKMDAYFEKIVLMNANKITTVSPGVKKLLGYKVGFDNVAVIYNGYDESDFAPLTEHNSDLIGIKARNSDSSRTIKITYIGTLSKAQAPTALMQAISNLHMRINNKRIRLEFIGAVHQSVKNELEHRFQLGDIITYRSYLPHREAIVKMQNTDFLVLVVPKTLKNKGIVTGKLFEYMRSMRPILLIGPPDSDAANIIRATQTGYIFGYDDIAAIEDVLIDPPSLTPSAIDQYNRKNLTGELARLFDKCC